jgi:hypothetical protein
MNKHIRPELAIALIVIIASMVGAGIWLYSAGQKEGLPANNQMSMQPATLKEGGTTETVEEPVQRVGQEEEVNDIGTDGWKTYRNEKYGYQLKYPGKFPIETSFSGKNNRIFTLSINSSKTETSGAGGFPKYLLIGFEPKEQATPVSCDEMDGRISGSVIISGNQYKKCLIEGSYFGEGEGLFVELVHGDYSIAFNADFYDRNKEILNKIISSFKFDD